MTLLFRLCIIWGQFFKKQYHARVMTIPVLFYHMDETRRFRYYKLGMVAIISSGSRVFARFTPAMKKVHIPSSLLALPFFFLLRFTLSRGVTSEFRLPTSDFRLLSFDYRLQTLKFKALILHMQLFLSENRVKLNQINIVAWLKMSLNTMFITSVCVCVLGQLRRQIPGQSSQHSRFCYLKELGHGVRLFTKLIHFAIISVKIQLIFNVTWRETNRTARYDVITLQGPRSIFAIGGAQ